MTNTLPPTKVRGIYATALTSLLIELGVPVADPSPIISERLGLSVAEASPAISIRDRGDRQGIVLDGGEADVRDLILVLQTALPRTASRSTPNKPGQWSLEFPAPVKLELDARRRAILPTIHLHHQLKTLSSDQVDQVERDLARAPERADELSEQVRMELIDRHIVPGMRFHVEHVKPAGQEYPLKGVVGSFDGRFLRLDRRFYPGGTYDSLDVPRLTGDYGRLDMEIGSGIAVRRYFRADGTHLGDLYNLATGAELYPNRVRYLDLELDVLHMPGEPPRVVDEADLERAYKRGFLTETLVEDAWTLAREVMRGIEDQAP